MVGGKIFLGGASRNSRWKASTLEIADAPIALWGHSAGGQFTYNLAGWKPERTPIAFVVNKGAKLRRKCEDRGPQVPALWILGAKDTEIRPKNITAKYRDGRKGGALWALVPEPNEGHEGRTKPGSGDGLSRGGALPPGWMPPENFSR